MIRLPCRNKDGQVVAHAIVDDAFAHLRYHCWHLFKGYPARSAVVADGGRPGRPLFLHHHVLPRSDGKLVDHINGDRLDNRRANLRHVTNQQNSWNGKAHVDSESGVRGVDFDKARRRWAARICRDGKAIMLGRYRTIDEAIAARRVAERLLFGAFAPRSGACG